jgi:hypothetical protein
MLDTSQLTQIILKRAEKRVRRREFFRNSGGLGIGLIAGAALSACGSDNDATAQTAAPTDPEILNFALNLEYLEAQFYQYAAFGVGLPSDLLTGVGTQGAVRGGRAVAFTDPVVAAYAKEIARDELDHVRFLRTALGASAVAQPAIDVGGTDPNGAFSVAARAAGLIGPGVVFDPYASDENFLLGAYIFEDVGVTALQGRFSTYPEQDLPGSCRRHPRCRGLPCRSHPDGALQQGCHHSGSAHRDRCDLGCAG